MSAATSLWSAFPSSTPRYVRQLRTEKPSSVDQDVIDHHFCTAIITKPGVLVNALSLKPCVTDG